MDKQPAAYILASSRKGTLYTGVSSNLVGRIWQHREHMIDGFSKQYEVTRLVWYALAASMGSAIVREKQIKKWNRDWKIRLIRNESGLERPLAGHCGFTMKSGFPPSRE